MIAPKPPNQTAAYIASIEVAPQLDPKIRVAIKEEIFRSIGLLGIDNVNMLCMDRLGPDAETGDVIISRDSQTNEWLARLNLDEIRMVYDFTGACMDYSDRDFY